MATRCLAIIGDKMFIAMHAVILIVKYVILLQNIMVVLAENARMAMVFCYILSETLVSKLLVFFDFIF